MAGTAHRRCPLRESRPNRYPTSSRAIAPLDRSRRTDDESATEDQLALFDETKQTLTARVARLDTGMAWAEDPPSRTRHFIANVDVEPSDVDGEVKVRCNYIVYRSRGETEQDFYVGTREDLLRWVEGGWKIARRRLILDQNVLTAKNLSILF